MPTPGPTAGPPPTRRRRPLRVALALLLLAALLLAAATWVALRPPVLGRIVAWRLSKMLGGEVEVASAVLLGGGRLRLEGLVVRAPGWPGAAGEIATVSTLVVELDEAALWRARFAPTSFVVGEATLRIAERADRPNELNLFALRPDVADAESTLFLPRIELSSVSIENGELLADGSFARLARTQVSGELRLAPGGGSEYAVRLEELGGATTSPEGALSIRGTFDRADLSAEFVLGRLRFDDRIRDFLPKLVRAWWARLDLRGELLRATLSMGRELPVRAELVVGDSELTIPVDAGVRWMLVRGGRMEPALSLPRLRLRGGTIRLDGRSASLERLEGQLIGTDPLWPLAFLPMRLSLTIPELPEMTWSDRARWLDEALATAPFVGKLELLDFSVGRRRPDEAIEVPYAVADVLDAFRLSNWQLSAEMHVKRGPPSRGADGRLAAGAITYHGKAAIADANMEYERFPYPLANVRGMLSFDQDAISIDSLRGRGRHGGDALVTGHVAPPGPQSGFELKIRGTDLPLDRRLRDALPRGARPAVESLLHEAAIQGLRDAGLMPDEASLRRERAGLVATLEALTADPAPPPLAAGQSPARGEAPEVASLRGQIAALDQRLDAGPIVPGGSFDFEVTVSRPVGGPTMPMSMIGSIDLAGVGGVFENFPYPFRIDRGSLKLVPNAITLGDGIDFVTAGGGRGRAEGRIDLPEDEHGQSRFLPSLRLTVVDDRVNPVLLAAIPPSRPDRESLASAGIVWPGAGKADAARIMEAAALQGELSASASIFAAPDGAVRWETLVELAAGSAMPTGRLQPLLTESALAWPPELAVSGLAAMIRVGPEDVRVDQLEGRAGGAALRASAAIDVTVEPPEIAVDAALDGLELAPWMAGLAPPVDRPKLVDLWNRIEPSGVVDATLRIAVDDGDSSTSLAVTPRSIDATLSDQRVRARFDRGQLELAGHALALRQVELTLETEGVPNGRILVDGRLPDGGAPGSLAGEWRDGRFECPVIAESMRSLGLRDALAATERLNLGGGFAATFRTSFGPAWELVDFDVALSPTDLSATVGGEPLHAIFQSDGRIAATPGRLELTGLRGTLDASSFTLSGGGALGPNAELALDLTLESPELGDPLMALMPAQVRAALERVALQVAGGVAARGQLGLSRRAEGWRGRWSGPIDVRRASLDPGVALTDVDGTLAIDAAGGGGEPAALRIDLALDRARVLGRRVDWPTGILDLDEGGTALRLRSLRGDVYGGAAELGGEIALADDGEYRFRLEVGGAGIAGLLLKDGRDPGPPGSPEEGSRGRAEARVDLAGRLGEPMSRRGRGRVRIVDARIGEMPLTMGLLQITQLMLPLHASFSAGALDFFVLGERATFEQIALTSDTLALQGGGTLELESLEIDLRLQTRGRLFLVSDLMQPLSSTIFAIDITGPLGEPRTALVPLPALGGILPSARRHGPASLETARPPPIAPR